MFHRPKTEQVTKNENAAEEKNLLNQTQDTQEDVKVIDASSDVVEEAVVVTDDAATEETVDTDNQTKKEENMSQEKPHGGEKQAEAKAGTMYQTHAAQPVSKFAPSTYPGAAAVQQQASAASSNTETSSGRRLVISEGITMSGEIAACDHLVVEGTVEAALQGANVLDIAETGTFYGSVEIDEATIAGRFEGEIAVNGRLTIKGSGVVTGSISYGELQVESGASIDGKISPRAAGAAQSQPTTKKVPARNDNQGQTQNAAELPFSGNAAAAE